MKKHLEEAAKVRADKRAENAKSFMKKQAATEIKGKARQEAKLKKIAQEEVATEDEVIGQEAKGE